MARIAYVMGRFPVWSETFIGNEIRALEAMGHEIMLIALHRPEGVIQQADEVLAARTHYFSPISAEAARQWLTSYRYRLPWAAKFVLSQHSEPRRALLVHAAEMANRMTQWGASHVHAHFAWGAASYAIAAARLAGLPMSFTCHGSDVYARPVDLSVKCRSAQAVVAVAPMIARDVAKLSGRSKCQLIYCGVDERQWLPLADRTQAHGRWLFVGRLVDCKGVDDVIDAWSLLPEGSRPVLDIVGEGELQPVLMAQCAAANLQSSIRFLGAKPTSWLMQHAPAYRALIAPFKQGADGSRDTAPLVLKEAMAMGLPIVSTDFVDVAAVVGDRCALLCPVSLPEALATAVLRIEQAGDDVLCEMGKAGRVRVSEYFTLSQQAKQMSDLFERMAR